MSKVQKTFYEGEDPVNVLNWVDGVIWTNIDMIDNRDPAEVRYELSDKIKIIIEIKDKGEVQDM